jgi:hypothetical protein
MAKGVASFCRRRMKNSVTAVPMFAMATTSKPCASSMLASP